MRYRRICLRSFVYAASFVILFATAAPLVGANDRDCVSSQETGSEELQGHERRSNEEENAGTLSSERIAGPYSRRQRRRLELARRRANPPQVGSNAQEQYDPSLAPSSTESADPDLRLLSVVVLDPPTGGNGDGWIQPGETVSLQLSLANFGNSAAHAVYGQLNPAESNPYVTILDKSGDWPDIPAHSTAGSSSPHFQLQVSNVLPCGYPVELSLEVRATGYGTTLPFHLDLARNYAFDITADAARRYNESDTVLYGTDSNDVLGYAVATGDINGDGFEDLIAGAPYGAGPGNAKFQAGEVWLIYGASEGLVPVVDTASPPASATVIYGPDANDQLGWSVSAGDVNGDGFEDLILGAYRSSGAGNAKPSAGEVWVIYGGATQLPASINLFSPPANAAVVYGPETSDGLGASISAGDVNGDGFDDLILGANGGDGAGNAKSAAGDVWVVYGRATQLPSSTDLSSTPSNTAVIYGPDIADGLGASASAGDVNGDGFDDLILGAGGGDGAGNAKSAAGEVWVVYGRTAQLPAPSAGTDLFSPPSNAAVMYGADTGDQLGGSVSAGDLNGDGFDDLIISAPSGDGAGNLKSAAGEVWTVYGRPTQLPASTDLFSPPLNAAVIYGANSGDLFGWSISAGDVSGDGFDDLIQLAPSGDGAGNTKPEAGDVWVIHGQAGSLPASIDLFSPPPNAAVIYGADAGDSWVLEPDASVSVGDVNGDGFDDVILGAGAADAANNGKANAGEAHVLLGAAGRTYWNKTESFAFINATTGTNLNLVCDDCSASVPIGFTFPFYGEKFTTLYVSTNGLVSFAPIDDAAAAVPRCIDAKSPSSLSSLPLIVAPFWDDLDLRSSGAVYSLLSGTAPNRRLTIEWLNVPHYPNTGAGTFEVSLFESTGQILFQYQDVTFGNASYDAGVAAVVGVQNRTRAEGTPYACSQATLAASQAISFNLTTPLFKDNMESINTAAGKPGKWTATGGISAWHTASGVSCAPNFHGRLKSLYEGFDATCTYTNNIAGDTLNLPQVSNFPADGRLAFWQRFQSEGGVDFGTVEIQGNGGGYSNLVSNAGGPGAWQYPSPLFLNASTGQTVDLRFRFTSNASNVGLGWMIDDLRLTGCNAKGISSLVEAKAFAEPAAICSNGVDTGLLDSVGSRCGDGSSPTGYQWLEDGTPIPGAMSISYTIPAGHPTGVFYESVVVTCPAGSATSDAQRIEFYAPPTAVDDTLRLAKQNAGADLEFTWVNVPGASDYVVFRDTIPNGSFDTAVGSSASGAAGLSVPMPPESLLFFKVAGRNPGCGVGPK